MASLIRRTRKFGDNIDTDTITPSSILYLPMNKLMKHAFEPVFPEFYRTVRQGDIIVAGKNFGCGSSREQATAVMKELGIQYIVCESMARIYYRNCIALGLYPIISRGVNDVFKEGDEIGVDAEKGVLENIGTKRFTNFKPLSGIPQQIVSCGGILALLKAITDKENKQGQGG